MGAKRRYGNDEGEGAAQRLFRILGDPQARQRQSVELGRCIASLDRRVHAVLFKQGIMEAHEREEIVCDVFLRLVRLNPDKAAAVDDGWKYFHRVIISATNDYIDGVVRKRHHEVSLTQEADQDGYGPAATDGLPGDGSHHANPESVALARDCLDLLRRKLSDTDYFRLQRWAAGYSTAEIIMAEREGDVRHPPTEREVHNMHQYMSVLVKRARQILQDHGCF